MLFACDKSQALLVRKVFGELVMYKRDSKQVGMITEKVAERHHLHEYVNRPIMQSLDFYVHIAKHIKDFKNVDNYMTILKKIPDVLKKPEFTFYDKNRQTILYFGKINEVVCYVVKLNVRKDYCFLATLYPISQNKLDKYKEKSYLKQD